jgi:hypothetical protein
MGFPHEHMRRQLVKLIDPRKAITFFKKNQAGMRTWFARRC